MEFFKVIVMIFAVCLAVYHFGKYDRPMKHINKRIKTINGWKTQQTDVAMLLIARILIYVIGSGIVLAMIEK